MPRWIGPVAAIGLLLAAAACTSNADTAEYKQAYLREHIVAKYAIGWSTKAPERRNVGRDLINTGWAGFVNGTVLPELRHRGLKRVLLHNPFGTLAGEAMQFDQYLSAKEAGLDWLTEGFVEAWQPVTAQGIEVIGYIGSPRLDPESQALIKKGDLDAFYRRAWATIEPLVQAGMAIGYDASSPASKDSVTYRFARKMREHGLKVYVESRPMADHPWWFDFPIISRESYWRKNLNFGPRELLRKEVIRLIKTENDWFDDHGPAEWPAEICDILREGDTVAILDTVLRSPARDLADFVDCVPPQSPASSASTKASS